MALCVLAAMAAMAYSRPVLPLASGRGQVHASMLTVHRASHIACAHSRADEVADVPAPQRRSLRRRVLQWEPLQRASLSFSLAAALMVGGAGPSSARSGPEPLGHTPEIEQLFLKKRWDRKAVEEAGIKPERIIEKVMWEEDKTSDAQKVLYELEDDQTQDDSERILGLVKFVGVSTVGIAVIGDAVKRIERVFKRREIEEMQKEIELTGSYINPFAGDVEEIVDPITGEKTKLKKKKAREDDGMGNPVPDTSPNAPKGDGDDGADGAGGIDVDDIDDEGKSNLDVLSDLL